MESKPKACCANCEWCDKNGYKCKRSGAFVDKWMFCTYYHGNGITPEQEILELKNKLVAQCTVVGTIPQFTKAEVEAIRKIAQFMGVTVADSIIAKCEAMLKGAQK